MNWLADESVDGPVVARLRLEGLAVVYVAELSPGISDDQVLAEAGRQDAILLTGDKDFGELVYRLHLTSKGVVLLRLAGLSPIAKARVVWDAVREHGVEMAGAFTVITPKSIRIRAGA